MALHLGSRAGGKGTAPWPARRPPDQPQPSRESGARPQELHHFEKPSKMSKGWRVLSKESISSQTGTRGHEHRVDGDSWSETRGQTAGQPCPMPPTETLPRERILKTTLFTGSQNLGELTAGQAAPVKLRLGRKRDTTGTRLHGEGGGCRRLWSRLDSSCL